MWSTGTEFLLRYLEDAVIPLLQKKLNTCDYLIHKQLYPKQRDPLSQDKHRTFILSKDYFHCGLFTCSWSTTIIGKPICLVQELITRAMGFPLACSRQSHRSSGRGGGERGGHQPITMLKYTSCYNGPDKTL